MKRVIYLVVAAMIVSAAVTGCKKDKPDELTERIAVNLRTDIKQASILKVANDQWEAGDEVGLFMARAGQKLDEQGAVWGNANNVKMSVNNGTLVATPPIMYPETGNVDFVAYHPYSASVGAGFTIPINVAGQTGGLPKEVVYSNNAVNQAATKDAVMLNFRYALAKITVTVTGNEHSPLTPADFDGMTVSVEGMFTQANLQLADGSFADYSAQQAITLRKTASTDESATFEALLLPTANEAVFVFTAGGTSFRYPLARTYASHTHYMLGFELKFPEIFATLLNTTILPRGTETENYEVSISTKQMTMTTAKEGAVDIGLKGTGTATIIWGDGIPSETRTLSSSNTSPFTHTYTGSTARTITIIGNVTELLCSSNELTELDVSNNTALTLLECSFNPLTSLDVSNNTALTMLVCYNNQLTSLDVSNNTELTTLGCFNNQLTSLDVSNNTALTSLDCYHNQLTSLDVSNNTALTMLVCYDNQLTSLDVSNNTELVYLDCYWNQLTSLDVSNNTALTRLRCNNNQFASAALCALFDTLHGNTGSTKYIHIGSNPGTAGAADCYSTAESKGWIVETRN